MQANAAVIAQFLTMLKLKDKLWHFKSAPFKLRKKNKQRNLQLINVWNISSRSHKNKIDLKPQNP